MAYEIDFVGVGDECKKDADAIALRWKDLFGNYKIAVYDGGLQAHGEKLEQHLNQYYFDKDDEKVIDYVICSHSDSDHTSGLKNILDKFEVQALYMNRPWLYVDDIWDKVKDGRITKDSLIRRLRDEYPYINDLEEIAQDKGIPIYEAFQGTVIDGKLRILSPSKNFLLSGRGNITVIFRILYGFCNPLFPFLAVTFISQSKNITVVPGAVYAVYCAGISSFRRVNIYIRISVSEILIMVLFQASKHFPGCHVMPI